jgi:MarR family transcriptional regulator, temperature-dependent positive regulator of motility
MGETPGPGLTALITRLSKAVYRRTSEERLGMTARQYVTLSFLRDEEGMTQNTLGETLAMDPNNLVLLLNDLESIGFAERRRDPADRRRHIVEITIGGRRALTRADRAQTAIEDDVLTALDAGERAQLRHLIIKALHGRSALPELAAEPHPAARASSQ